MIPPLIKGRVGGGCKYKDNPPLSPRFIREGTKAMAANKDRGAHYERNLYESRF